MTMIAWRRLAAMAIAAAVCVATVVGQSPTIGQEHAVERHLKDGDEFRLPIGALIDYGRKLFCANWTEDDGGGRPLTRGSGARLIDPSHPLRGMRAFNRLSGPDANSCQGCHNAPYGIAGGHGDIVTNAIELADRFDFVTFDKRGPNGETLGTVGNSRSTPGLFGAGYVEMIARQLTRDLQQIRDSIAPAQSTRPVVQGISFGTLARRRHGSWDARAV